MISSLPYAGSGAGSRRSFGRQTGIVLPLPLPVYLPNDRLLPVPDPALGNELNMGMHLHINGFVVSLGLVSRVNRHYELIDRQCYMSMT